MNIELEEREVVAGAAKMWWVFLLTGIAWLVFALAVFQWDFTTVYAVSYLFGFVALLAGLNEFFSLGVWTTGWKIVHGIVGAVFIVAGIWALVHGVGKREMVPPEDERHPRRARAPAA